MTFESVIFAKYLVPLISIKTIPVAPCVRLTIIVSISLTLMSLAVALIEVTFLLTVKLAVPLPIM